MSTVESIGTFEEQRAYVFDKLGIVETLPRQSALLHYGPVGPEGDSPTLTWQGLDDSGELFDLSLEVDSPLPSEAVDLVATSDLPFRLVDQESRGEEIPHEPNDAALLHYEGGGGVQTVLTFNGLARSAWYPEDPREAPVRHDTVQTFVMPGKLTSEEILEEIRTALPDFFLILTRSGKRPIRVIREASFDDSIIADMFDSFGEPLEYPPVREVSNVVPLVPAEERSEPSRGRVGSVLGRVAAMVNVKKRREPESQPPELSPGRPQRIRRLGGFATLAAAGVTLVAGAAAYRYGDISPHIAALSDSLIRTISPHGTSEALMNVSQAPARHPLHHHALTPVKPHRHPSPDYYEERLGAYNSSNGAGTVSGDAYRALVKQGDAHPTYQQIAKAVKQITAKSRLGRMNPASLSPSQILKIPKKLLF